MDTAWTAALGAVQGLTEFLPISSSGHLAAAELAAPRLGFEGAGGEEPLLFGILLHVATLAAVLVYYRAAAWDAIRGFGRGVAALARGGLGPAIEADEGTRLAAAICVGTLPTGALGLALERPTGGIAGSPLALGLCFLACAAILVATRWWPGGARRLDWRVALIVGIVQGIAVLPGVSRSGATIAAGLALGLPRDEAVRFSFLLSVPAIAGAALLELDGAALAGAGEISPLVAGCAAAFVAGFASLAVLRRIVRGGRLWLFAPYVAAVGAALVIASRA
ncbi:MAG: undecaprenyl-diphosphate phosphatase [Proteobacteria bacterium]|jgi:undecaprenyl-diphosphatase|nr:undecaprenyl-diphosphate phosphatase [Pseudomonadota bacterium]